MITYRLSHDENGNRTISLNKEQNNSNAEKIADTSKEIPNEVSKADEQSNDIKANKDGKDDKPTLDKATIKVNCDKDYEHGRQCQHTVSTVPC